MHPLVQLAKEAVEKFVAMGETMAPWEITAEMQVRAGAFVSIKLNGELRGCIGTIAPTRANLAEEIVQNAIGSALRDPRFPPVMVNELPYLSYSVDVLSSPELVAGEKELDPKRYGVIVESGDRRGLLLPDLEGVDTPEHQVLICKLKAGIGFQEPVTLYRFEVKRYS